MVTGLAGSVDLSMTVSSYGAGVTVKFDSRERFCTLRNEYCDLAHSFLGGRGQGVVERAQVPS